MEDNGNHETLFSRDSAQFLTVNMQGEVATEPTPGTVLMIDKRDPFKLAPTDVTKGALVNILTVDKLIPRPRIRSMFTGQIEQFRAEIGTSPESYVLQPAIVCNCSQIEA